MKFFRLFHFIVFFLAFFLLFLSHFSPIFAGCCSGGASKCQPKQQSCTGSGCWSYCGWCQNDGCSNDETLEYCKVQCYPGSVPCDSPDVSYRCTVQCSSPCGSCNNAGDCCYTTITPSPSLTPTVTPTSPPPTSTPTPTSTPIPSPTPTLTSTPTPTFTPTPTPPAACKCDSITYSGTIAPGNTVTFTAYATAVYPDTTKVLHMIYHVEINGTEVARSGNVPATEISGTPGRYSTSWSYTIPTSGTGVAYYRVWVEIVCAYKTAGLNTTQTKTVVLGATNEKKVGFFDLLIRAITSFFKGQSTPVNITPTPAALEESGSSLSVSTAPFPTDTPIPDRSKSIKLKTLGPPSLNIKLGCTSMTFEVPYDYFNSINY